jgi:hypothetical protein
MYEWVVHPPAVLLPSATLPTTTQLLWVAAGSSRRQRRRAQPGSPPTRACVEPPCSRDSPYGPPRVGCRRLPQAQLNPPKVLGQTIPLGTSARNSTDSPFPCMNPSPLLPHNMGVKLPLDRGPRPLSAETTSRKVFRRWRRQLQWRCRPLDGALTQR